MRQRLGTIVFASTLALALSVGVDVAPVGASPVDAGRESVAYEKTGFPRPPATYAGDVIGFDGTPGVHRIHVWSTAMSRYVPIILQAPAAATKSPAALMLLLNGSDGGEGGDDWFGKSDVFPSLAERNLYLLSPADGAASYYTDWKSVDPVVGRPRWETFLNHELVDAVAPVFARTTGPLSGKRSVVGVSMAATSAFNLAATRPGFWTSAASISGCQNTSTETGRGFVRTVTGAYGADAENMWGPVGDPAWDRNDSFANAEKLRGTHLYLFSGYGEWPGPRDHLGDPYLRGFEDPEQRILLNQMTTGALLENLTGRCTTQMRDRLTELGIPATVVLEPSAKHSWGYFRDGLHRGLPGILEAIGA